MSLSSSYWCYRCNRFIRVWTEDSIICPNCDGGFVEETETSDQSGSQRHFPVEDMYMMRNTDLSPAPVPPPAATPRIRRSRRNVGERSPFNPVIVLRGPSNAGGGFELFYDDGAVPGLRPLPASMSEFLLGTGFDRLLDQLAQIEANGLGPISDNPPASKAATESMPRIDISENHICTESHCAVCKEPFELGTEAREMPCKHIYHSDCILPWLSLRNSCPVCRHQLPTDSGESDRTPNWIDGNNNDDETVGLTIWRLPGGGFAVGRFSGGIRGGERELPVVFTEMDGGFNNNNNNNNNNGIPRRISWGSRGTTSQETSGTRFRRALRNMFACFGGSGSRQNQTSSSLDSRILSLSSVMNSGSRRRRDWIDVPRRW